MPYCERIMDILFLTVFLSTLLVCIFVILFFAFKKKDNKPTRMDQESLLPLEEESYRIAKK